MYLVKNHLVQLKCLFLCSCVKRYLYLLDVIFLSSFFFFVVLQGFTYPVRTQFLENVLEITGHRLTPYNQIDDYGQEKGWKMQKQALRKRKSQIASVVEVWKSLTNLK